MDTPADGSLLKMRRHQLARAGQIILSEIWGKKGAIGIVPEEGDGALCTSHFFLFDLREDMVDRGWLNWIFRANYLQPQLEAKAFGTTGYAAVRPKDLLSAEIPLPPLSEQRRIVARLDQLSGQLRAARTLNDCCAEQSSGLHRSAAEALFQKFGREFRSIPLADICRSITDGDHNTPRFEEDGVRFVFVGNVSTGRLHFHGCRHVSRGYFAGLSDQRVPAVGDILYSAVGATLGIPALVDVDQPFCFQRHIAILKLNRQMADPVFTWHMLRSWTLFRRSWASTTGSAQPTVPLRAIRNLPFPLVPLDTQRTAAERLERLRSKTEIVSKLQGEISNSLGALEAAVLADLLPAQDR